MWSTSRRANRCSAGARRSSASSPPTPSCSPPPLPWPASAPKARSAPRFAAREELDTEECLPGDLYLRGGGDPSFGSARYAARYYGSPGATVESLAKLLEQAGIERVTGRVVGDESAFDSLRGGPESGFGVSPWVGPLSGLSFNRGFADERGRSWQLDRLASRPEGSMRRSRPAGSGPPEAARRNDPRGRGHARERRLAADGPAREDHQQALGQLLRRDAAQGPRAPGERSRDYGGGGATGGRLRPQAGLRRPPSRRIRPLTCGPRLTAPDRPPARRGLRARSGAVRRRLRRLAADRPGRDGTLVDRMRRGPARSRCRGKTGTLSNVSALSGYCEALSGDTYAYSILMNFVYPPGARRLQGRDAPIPCRAGLARV